MSAAINFEADYLFEISWEVCNKVGGIHTVITSKVPFLEKKFNENYILIGPDILKESAENPEFTEDRHAFRLWKEKAAGDGIFFRVGRWNVPGNPLVILVDFTHYFSQKDKIFEELWLNYKVDSISGQWDYIEPALFGYAAGRVIESFYQYYVTSQDRIIAHFHEWMTATGVLYLKENIPQIGTVFTTYATILGRTLALNGLPFFSEMASYDAEAMARKYNIISKFTLERAAALNCDVFTTVSELISAEAGLFLGRTPDKVTPNGIDARVFNLGSQIEPKRKEARKRLLEVGSAICSMALPDDTFFVIHSGRYEFRNKGTDLFIDTLSRLNAQESFTRPVVAVLAIPANPAGPRRELIDRIQNRDYSPDWSGKLYTHTIFNKDQDPVLNRLREKGLVNRPEDKVKVIFTPTYLPGNDGIFNMSYYELITGFDLGVFPSYYESWGYTPLESIAIGVPAITSSLSGFGVFVQKLGIETGYALQIVKRTDNNDEEATEALVTAIRNVYDLTESQHELVRQTAIGLAQHATWDRFVVNYWQAFQQAQEKVELRKHLFRSKQQAGISLAPVTYGQKIEWKKILIKPAIPPNLTALEKLSRNLWWSWNHDAVALFESIDPNLWKSSQHNPITLLESLTFKKLQELAGDESFLSRLDAVHKRFEEYMNQSARKPACQIAYFSMEYGLHDSLKIYSGGLGVLAGDYLKEASDSNQNLVGVGLLYRYGYFQQNLSLNGEQITNLIPQKFTQMPLTPVRDHKGNWVMISLALPGRVMYAKVWRVDVGRIPLYLLDTDIPENTDADKSVTHQLYGGDWENRFKQELLLGVGGIRMLHALNIHPDIYHLNEGHAAFAGLERLRHCVHDHKLNFHQAVEYVRASSLFTTHTPVPAGHDAFSEDLLRAYIPHYAERLNITWEEFMDLGRWVPGNTGEKFSMSVLAARLSQEMNGVSKIHGRVTREMFVRMFPGYFPNELYIGYVTNGVHYPTWAANAWQKLYRKEFGEGFPEEQSNEKFWQKIHQVDDTVIWEIRNQLRSELIAYLKQRVQADLRRRQENPKNIVKVLDSMKDNVLTIGFARRFATYKRAHLLFNDPERLKQLVNQPGKPIQLIFAGKAHPADKEGQKLIKMIMDYANTDDFRGKITFVENYDMELAQKLIQGVDIWLNTPTRPLEASGTSGEKAVMNGVVNLSVLDGWWAEGFRPDAGWALPEERTYTNQELQDELDSLSIYNILENEIIPLFYKRNDDNIPHEWISYIKNTISGIAPHFTMKRMLDDYISKYYNKLYERSQKLKENNYELVRELAAWKRRIRREWDHIEVLDVKVPDSSRSALDLGGIFGAEVTLGINSLSPNDIGVEILFGQKENDEVKEIQFNYELNLVRSEGKKAVFAIEFPLDKAGVYDYAFRIFPKNALLPHWQDIHLVTWF